MLQLVFLSLFAFSQGFLFSSAPPGDWNGLKTTWGLNPISSLNYASMPRTVADAKKANWIEDASVKCGSNSMFAGNRYVQQNDKSVMLLFDKNGYIAGLQTGVAKDSPLAFKGNNMFKVWNAEANLYTITAYFVDPATICSVGRTPAQYSSEGTGNKLYVQSGATPKDLMSIPLTPAATAGTKWVKGKCFYTMGLHYWYNLQENMSCDDVLPMFLLYNKGKLNGFGWAIPAAVKGDRFEKPPTATFSAFMETVPKCLKNVPGGVTTMHIFLTDSVVTNNFC